MPQCKKICTFISSLFSFWISVLSRCWDLPFLTRLNNVQSKYYAFGIWPTCILLKHPSLEYLVIVFVSFFVHPILCQSRCIVEIDYKLMNQFISKMIRKDLFTSLSILSPTLISPLGWWKTRSELSPSGYCHSRCHKSCEISQNHFMVKVGKFSIPIS